MEVFKNKHSRKSYRLPNWDYSGDGWYFVTICTKGMVQHFGKIRNFIMGLNEMGCVVHEEWKKTGELRDNVILDEFVVMPNHVHGIIIIDNERNHTPTNVGTRRGASLQGEQLNNFGSLIPKSLSSIMNQFKGAVKRWCNKNGHPNFQWQSRFYDHIIESDKELHEIREYIYYNPQMWNRDRNNPNKL